MASDLLNTYPTVVYSRKNTGRSRGKPSMTGCAVPNMLPMVTMTKAPKCDGRASGSAESRLPAPSKMRPNSRLRKMVMPKRPISAALSRTRAWLSRVKSS